MLNRIGFSFLWTIVAFGLVAGAMAVSPSFPPQPCCMPPSCCAAAVPLPPMADGDAAQPPCCRIEAPPSSDWLALTVRPPAENGDTPFRPAPANGSFPKLSPRHAAPLPLQHDLPRSRIPVYIQTMTLLC